MFQNLMNTAQNMTPEAAATLGKNDVLMQALSDPEFEKKLQEVAADPVAAAKYAGDAGFMRAF